MKYLVKCCKEDNILQANYIIATDDSKAKIDEILEKDNNFIEVSDKDEVELFFIKKHILPDSKIETKIIYHKGEKEQNAISFLLDNDGDKELLIGVAKCDEAFGENNLPDFPKENFCANAENFEELSNEFNYSSKEDVLNIVEYDGKKSKHHFLLNYLKKHFHIMFLTVSCWQISEEKYKSNYCNEEELLNSL